MQEQVAPPFRLTALTGNEVSLSEVRSDHPILLFFFKTTCPVCQLETPFIERLFQSGARVVAIGQDLDRKELVRYRDEYRLTMPILGERPGYVVSNAYNIDVVPTLFIIGPEGNIRERLDSFNKTAIASMAESLGVPAPFTERDSVPAFRPG